MGKLKKFENLDQYINHANSLYSAGKTSEAISYYLQASKIYPNQPAVLNNLAAALSREGKIFAAVETLKKVILVDSKNSNAYYNLGTILKNQKKFIDSSKNFKISIRLNPNLIPAHNNLALCFKEMGKFDQSINVFKKAIGLAPNDFSLHYNLGNVYRETFRPQEAITHYLKARQISPSNPEIYFNLGLTYILLDKYSEAQANLKQALALLPDSPMYYYHLGHAFYRNSQFKEAIQNYQKTIALQPGFEFAESCLFMAKRRMCEWEGLSSVESYLDKTSNEDPWGSIVRTEDPLLNLKAATLWSEKIEKSVPYDLFHFKITDKNSKNKIRLGYISGNFGDHPVGYTTASVFDHHDHTLFETIAYSYGKSDKSVFRKNIERQANKFVDISKMLNEEAAQKIFEDNVDILIDLTGYTEGNRLEICAMRPAPLQITWAGLLGTSGAGFFDYNIVDKILVPPAESHTYSEKLVYLPPCSYICSDKLEVSKKKLGRKDFGLPEREFVFGSFNQMYKIEPAIWKVWMNILKRTPRSVIWLLDQNNNGKINLQNYAEKMGVNKDRLIFSKMISFEDNLARLKLADLSLDAKTYGGGSTTYLMLSSGVPVITIKGTHFASRLCTSILTKAGLEKLSCNSLEEYEDLAVELASDSKALSQIKSKLSSDKTKKRLFNPSAEVKYLEKAYLKMWSLYQEGKSPQQIII